MLYVLEPNWIKKDRCGIHFGGIEEVEVSKNSQGSSFNVCQLSLYADTFALTVRVCVRICTRRSNWVILRLGSSSRKLKIDTLIMAMPKRTHFKADRNTTEFNLYQKIHCRSFKILQLRYKHLCSLYRSVKNSITVSIPSQSVMV